MDRRTCLGWACGAAVAPWTVGRAAAQGAFPSRTVTIVVPYATGGPTDMHARALAPRLAEAWGQPVIVENRGGAGTMIGTQAVAKAAPDGHTLLYTSYAFTSNPVLRRQLPYDPASLAPLLHTGTGTLMLLMSGLSSLRTLRDVIEHARSAPGALKLASSGNASSPHIAAALFARAIGAEITHVPYRGAGPSVADVMAGVGDGTFDGSSNLPNMQAGRLRPVGTAGDSRHPLVPDVPTFREQGVDLVFGNWYGFFAPGAPPEPVQRRIEADLRAALADPKAREPIVRSGLRLAEGSRTDFAAFLKREAARLQALVDSGATIPVD